MKNKLNNEKVVKRKVKKTGNGMEALSEGMNEYSETLRDLVNC